MKIPEKKPLTVRLMLTDDERDALFGASVREKCSVLEFCRRAVVRGANFALPSLACKDCPLAGKGEMQ